MQLVFATYNTDKLLEVKNLLNVSTIKLLSLSDIDFTYELPEPHNTITANAIEKATHLYRATGYDCFSDDSGLEVQALHAEPGVHSARYAGPQKNDKDNIKKLLLKLENHANKKARFISVICLILEGKTYLFEGTINGIITHIPIGTDGFGYDPVFLPDGYSKTFAQMSLEEKNHISHRAIAIRKLCDFLNTL